MESLIILAASLSGILATVQPLAMVAIGLGFVIFVHELGHFLVAKACGVKCEKFYIGFDVPLNLGFIKIPGKLVHFQYGETEYGIGAIPLGGYVKMLGQDDNPANAEEESQRSQVRDEAGKVRLDPRSYQAKSVPQRMAIISAGVIMNLIFGLIFAAIAYRGGVMIQPAVVGHTSPGDPAWKQNLQPGDRILQLGKEGQPNEHMRFMKDMMLNLALYGSFDREYDVLIRPEGGGEPYWVAMKPSDRFREVKDGTGTGRPTLGLSPAETLKLGSVPTELLPLFSPDLVEISVTDADGTHPLSSFDDLRSVMATRGSATVKLATHYGDGDTIVAVDGEPVSDYPQLQRLLAARGAKPVVLTIERAPKKEKGDSKSEHEASASAAKERYELTLQPRPVVDYGIEMELSPITGVQKDSPAEAAGFLPGDRLLAYNGEPIGDAMGFPQKTLADAGKKVEIEVERPDGDATKRLTLSPTLRAPAQLQFGGAMSTALAVETLGIAYEVTPKVASVDPQGPAAGKLEPGDRIEVVKFLPAGKAQEQVELARYGGKAIDTKKEMTLDGKQVGWPKVVFEASVYRMPDSQLHVTARRGEKVVEVSLTPRRSTTTFLDDRGLPLLGLEELHRADGIGEALALGAREMKERITEVGAVVMGLITRKFSLFQMGGIPSIIGHAQSEAKRGLSDLLMFLAFLSANLAVLNFLPIPVLDGGHMMFLLYEGIRRKPVNPQIQTWLTFAGLAFLLGLMLLVNGLDIMRLFS